MRRPTGIQEVVVSILGSAAYPSGPLGQSNAPSDWYSGGRGFDPRFCCISFVKIMLVMK